MSDKIKINSALAEEIEELHGIGPRLAVRICEYRSLHGDFDSFHDLAQVDGVGTKLAKLLDTQIDWSPSLDLNSIDKNITPSLLQLLAIFINVLITMLLIFKFWKNANIYYELLFVETMAVSSDRPKFHLIDNIIRSAYPIFIDVYSILLVLLLSILGCFRRIDLSIAKSLVMSVIIWGSLTAVIGIYMSVSYAAQLIMYPLNLGTWLNPYEQLPNILFGFLSISTVVPLNIALLSVASKKLYQRITASYILLDVIYFFIIISSMGLNLWRIYPSLWGNLAARIFFENEITAPNILLSIYSIILLGSIMYMGISGIRENRHFSETVLDIITGVFREVMDRTERANTDWIRWVNERLPDPKSQKELAVALNQRYPPSRSAFLFNFLIVAVGGWFMLTILGATIEYFVGVWLDSKF